MTQRELGFKHGCSGPAIANMVKRHGWQRDLTEAIKLATKAQMIEQTLTLNVSGREQEISDAVKATAAVNVAVVMQHRGTLVRLMKLAEDAEKKLIEMSEQVADVREAKVFADGVAVLTSTHKTIQEQQRKAHGLDDPESKKVDAVEDLIMEAVGER